MDDRELPVHPAVAPRSIRSVTAAVTLVGVAAVAGALESVPGGLAAISGVATVGALGRLVGDDRRRIAAGCLATVLAVAVAALGGWLLAATATEWYESAVPALLWLATVAGVGIGRDVVRHPATTRALGAALAGTIGIALVPGVLVAGAASQYVGAPVAPIARAVLGLHAPRPTLGTALAVAGSAALLAGIAAAVTRRAIRPSARHPSVAAIERRGLRYGAIGLAAGAVAALFGHVLRLYAVLETASPTAWYALALVTSSTPLRVLCVGVAAIALSLLAIRVVTRRAWSIDGLRSSAVVAAVGLVTGSGLGTVVLAAGGWGVGPSAAGAPITDDVPAVWVPAVATLATFLLASLLLVVLDAHAAVRRRDLRDAAPGVAPCVGALLAAAVVLAAGTEALVAPVIAIGAATIVWDVGRAGALMGVELGAAATIDRGPLVRAAGSLVVGAVATAVAVGLGVLGTRIGRLLQGPILGAIAIALVLVAALLGYARVRSGPDGRSTTDSS